MASNQSEFDDKTEELSEDGLPVPEELRVSQIPFENKSDHLPLFKRRLSELHDLNNDEITPATATSSTIGMNDMSTFSTAKFVSNWSFLS